MARGQVARDIGFYRASTQYCTKVLRILLGSGLNCPAAYKNAGIHLLLNSVQ